MSARLAVMEADDSIDVLGISSLGGLPWLRQSLVENNNSRRVIGEAIK